MGSKQFWWVVLAVLAVAAYMAWNNDRFLTQQGAQLDRDLARERAIQAQERRH